MSPSLTKHSTLNVKHNEKRSTSKHGAGASYQTSHTGILARAITFGRYFLLPTSHPGTALREGYVGP